MASKCGYDRFQSPELLQIEQMLFKIPNRNKKSVRTSQEGHSHPHCYFSAAAWCSQLVLERDLAPERIPQVFRGRTQNAQLAQYPAGVAAPDPGANYCEACGILVVAQTYHEASAQHKAAAKARGPASSHTPAAAWVELAAVQEQMHADPAFAAAILASAAVGAGHPASAAPATRPLELLGPAGSDFADVFAPRVRTAAQPTSGGWKLTKT